MLPVVDIAFALLFAQEPVISPLSLSIRSNNDASSQVIINSLKSNCTFTYSIINKLTSTRNNSHNYSVATKGAKTSFNKI